MVERHRYLPIADHDVYLSVDGCVTLGMDAIIKCDYGG